MKVYIVVKRTRRAEYRKRQFRRYINRAVNFVDVTMNILIAVAGIIAAYLVCAVDGMEFAEWAKDMCLCGGAISVFMWVKLLAKVGGMEAGHMLG